MISVNVVKRMIYKISQKLSVIELIVFETKRSYIGRQKTHGCVLKFLFDASSHGHNGKGKGKGSRFV